MSKATRRIHNFDFKKEHHHVSLVDKAANLTEVMVMKSDQEVTVSLSMRDFLQKFYNLWSEDAASLASVLGFSDGRVKLQTNNDIAHDMGGVYDNYPKYVNEDGSNPLMYKCADEFLAGEFSSLNVLKGQELPDKLPYSVTQKILAVEKAYDLLSKASKDSSEEDNVNIEKGESKVDLTKEEIEKQAADLEASQSELEVLKAQVAEMETLKGLVATLKAKEEATAKADMQEVVKGYAFVQEDDQEALVDSLLKLEDNAVILKALEAGREAVAAAVSLDQEDGAAGGDAGDAGSETEISKGHEATVAILKSRKKGNS